MKRDTSRKRDSILDAATRVFVAEGYDRASMDRIAGEADASKRTVYGHFASKEILFRAVVDRFLRQSHALKRIPYDPARGLASQLNRFAEAIVELTRNAEWLGIVKVMTSVVVVQPGLVAESMARVNIKEDSLETWLRAAAADGRLRVGNPGLAARAFWAALNGAFLMPALYVGPLPEEAVAALKKELVQLLLSKYATGKARPEGARRHPEPPHAPV